MQGKILVCIFVLICAVLAEDGPDEFYCKLKKDNWEVCRKCNDTNAGGCDGVSHPNECKCDGIRIFKKDSFDEGYGGIDHCEKEGWCFVKMSSEDPPVCLDQEWHFDNERFTTDPQQSGSPYIWLTQGTEFAKSKMACNGKQSKIANEEMLQDIKITTDFLKNATLDDNGIEILDENMEFLMESPEECKEECENRYQCGAWSYDTEELLCYLHTVDSCCGQFDKREPVSGFISGYVCQSCWSTRGECPCPAEERFRKVGTAHSTGGKPLLHVTSTGLGTIHCQKLNKDICACEYRSPRPGVVKCVRPMCKDASTNPYGLCEDEGRCRKTCPANAKLCGPAPEPEPESSTGC